MPSAQVQGIEQTNYRGEREQREDCGDNKEKQRNIWQVSDFFVRGRSHARPE
uniref:Uncharacterized protein n=1 Tax=Melanopsichium pennsylvanicum 4 TaxID=1398559 RepID=A0A077RCQ3_9BASI|nr:uncharacterized protein BN887_06200 [Melanopsichium pennsylvanicum 4]